MSAPNLSATAVCGLFCRACPLYLGSTEAPALLEAFMKRSGKSREEATCHGCRSDVLAWHCKVCTLRSCAHERGVAFCAECPEFPCVDFQAFAAGELKDPAIAGKRPHRLELMGDCAAIKERGWQVWATAKVADHSCASCGSVNSAYALKCPKCAHVPGNAYVARHREAVIGFMSRGK